MPRIIYSLQFDLETDGSGESVRLIAQLNSEGQSQYIRPCRPKRRVIDLRVGDFLRHKGKRYRIVEVRAYRENFVDQIRKTPADGYVVRGS